MEIVKTIANKVKEKGGNSYYVGGYVRDKLLGIDNKDVDIEVHGIKPNELYEILKEIGEPLEYGDSFGVYSLKGFNIDIAMPRSEKAIGRGHRDFEVEVDPFIGLKKASQRRDFTINSLMEDVLSGELIDNFNGLNDLKNKVIRHVDSNTFVEDPLRVLRAAQFASRFEFKISEDTINLCKTIDLAYLSKERVEEELKKALIKGKKPSIFFETLKEMNQLDYWFIELKQLINLKQDPLYHPEGGVWVHTMEVIDRAVKYRDKVNPYPFMLLCLCHDFGKIATTIEMNNRIHSYNHEVEGLFLIDIFIKRITNKKSIRNYLDNMVFLHMLPNIYAHDNSSIKSTNKMFYSSKNPIELIYFSVCDKGDEKYLDYLFNRYEIYKEMINKPYVTGQDLVDNGISPNKDFNEYLDYAHKLRMAGVEKDKALKQTLAYIRKKKG